MIRLALYQVDIPQNLGTLIRLAACMDIPMDIIEPCGFPFDDKKFKRAGMDYIDYAALHRHPSWNDFLAWRNTQPAYSRIILLSTKATTPYSQFQFKPGDILMVGRETAGVPESVHAHVDDAVIIPMYNQMRSLNVAVAASMVVGEALRQTGHFDRA
ncbi:MAG: tRNA (cytidine(34)-2'-O)-methyltransferase [Alphaproteobacteria bacterium]|nr:tRNA (cytidine(34)-2'-O)-methyltransferase [Alphaproteobacteria bacterium]